MISAYFSRCDFVSVEFLPIGQRYQSHFFPETVSPSIKRKLTECGPKLQTTTPHLHVDNAAPHISKMSTEKIDEPGFILMAQPVYSPDLAPCDSFFFGHLKHDLEGKQFTREEQVISAVREVFDKAMLQTLQNVMDESQY
jgi:hypothetical protein